MEEHHPDCAGALEWLWWAQGSLVDWTLLWWFSVVLSVLIVLTRLE
jgi:hypothetical protein